MNDQTVKDFQNAVYVFANAVGGLAEITGMQALNQYRINREETIAYDDEAFQKVMLDRGLNHNTLMEQIYK